MAQDPQTTRLLFAKLLGFVGTIESHSEIVVKRMNSALRHVPGDGKNQVKHLHDPVVDLEEVTLEFVPDKNTAMLGAAQTLFDQHVKLPGSAAPVLLMSQDDFGSIVDSASLMRGVIQSVTIPKGNSEEHSLAMAKIVVQPERLVNG
jgi:hypothetical protein